MFNAKYALETSEIGENTWSNGEGSRLEQLVLMGQLQWVFRSIEFGLLISKQEEQDFRLISEWTTNFVNTVECEVQCSDTFFPTGSPSLSPTDLPSMDPTHEPSMSPTHEPSMTPTQSPTPLPRYPIEVEHHLTGVNTIQWSVYDVEPVYKKALSFTFNVEEDEIDIRPVESIQPVNRRMLQDTPSLKVTAVVNFIDFKRFEEFKGILESSKGRQSLNTFFNYLFTEDSQLDTLAVEHMGIQGDFDMVSYFTTLSPTTAPTDSPTTYVDNGDAVMIQEEVELAQMEIFFEGAFHNDVNFHQLLTDILDSESTMVVDTRIIDHSIKNGTHSVIVDLDCDFVQCAPHWRNDSRLSVVEKRMQQESGYANFRILEADVEKQPDSEMEVSEIIRENDTYLLLFLGFVVVTSCVMCWKYWKVCFFNKNLEDIDMKDYVDEVIAVQNHMGSLASLSSVYASDTEMHNEFEGCETLAVFGNPEPEHRQREFSAPVPVNYDEEGFAPTQAMFDQKRQIGSGESEHGIYHERRSTNECAVDVYVNHSPSTKRNPKSFSTLGSGISDVTAESDTDVTLYGDYNTPMIGTDEEKMLSGYWA